MVKKKINFIYNDMLIKLINDSLVKLPTPMNITIMWNFGSLLGLCMLIQVLTGLFLTMHYVSNINYSFFSIIHIMQDVNYGWMIRLIHMNGASVFFICVYMHIGRGIYYGSYKFIMVWFIGVLILLLMMGTAFMGYVLPWGQMSFWGATVITNLLSALPFIGQMLVEWLWGGFSVDNPTLNRFYTFHFFLPFILMFMIILHLMYLHETGSNNPLGLFSNFYKIKFNNYFILKDLVGFMILLYLLMLIVLEYPYVLGDPENFIMANSMVTPIHIQPEWYFLFAYTILRSIPDKMIGVLALLFSILVLLLMPFLNMNKFKGISNYFLSKIYFWFFLSIVILLTLLGAQPVEYPYIGFSQYCTILYFSYFYIDPVMKFFFDWMLNL
uniref:Cytochrome b n=1 Tax=Capitonius sp. QL-2013 TaxID=1421593 RepID=A0A0A6ZL32_9HYME|nr:cytochrome b [Capitonius sp. QL-2013]